MSNNIGVLSSPTKFPRTIGGTLNITDPSVLNAVSGEVDIGFMAFDTDGTLGVCTAFTRDQGGNPTYTFRTSSLNTEIDVQNILSQSY